MTRKKYFLLAIPIILVISLFIFRKSVDRLAVGQNGCFPQDLSGIFNDFGGRLGFFEGENPKVPDFINSRGVAILGAANPDERWIEIDLSEQKLKAWNGNSLFLETAIASGLPWWPTPTGEFRVWIKLRYTGMEGGEGRYYYNLPNVPFVMFFENDQIPGWRGFGLHGTYWHNSFGTPRSHGCVNLPTDIAERLFYWISPVAKEGSTNARASKTNPGTRVVIHK